MVDLFTLPNSLKCIHRFPFIPWAARFQTVHRRAGSAKLCRSRAKLCSLVLPSVALVLVASCASSVVIDGQPITESVGWSQTGTREPVPYTVPDVGSRNISFETTEGTLMSVDVSPDGQTLVFDLLGDIYLAPIDGGEASPLTSGRGWDQSPRFSLDGEQVYFVSDRKGFKNIWRVRLKDQSVHQITRADSHILGGPNWSQNGRHLLVGVGDPRTANSEITLHAIDPANGDMTPIDEQREPWIDWDTFKTYRPNLQIYSGVESTDGYVFYSQSETNLVLANFNSRIFEFDLGTKTRTALTSSDGGHNEFKPLLSHDGQLLAYFRQYRDRRTELRIRNRRTEKDELIIGLLGSDDPSYSFTEDSRPNYAFTPDDKQLIFWHNGKIHRVNISSGESEVIPFRARVERTVWERAEPPVTRLSESGVAKAIRWPKLSSDGETMVFAAVGYIWVMNPGTNKIRRLTRAPDFEYMPALSPNNRSVAYISFAESEDGTWASRLMVADIDGGPPRQLIAEPNEIYYLPKWSPDGSMLALIREKDVDGKTEAAFGWTSATTGMFEEVAKAPASSEPLGWNTYARFVDFDEAGRNLLISFSRSRKETILAIAPLDGSARKTLAVSTSEVDGITPAPDLKNLALTREDGTVWVIPFDASVEHGRVSTLSPDARRVSEGGGYYIDWVRPNQVTFGFGQNVYRYQLNHNELSDLRVDVHYAKPMATQPIAFTGARIITLSEATGSEAVIESGTIVSNGHRITGIGEKGEVEIPAESIVIDATGKTIIPGLIDTHYHRIGGNDGMRGMAAFKVPNPRFSDRSAIAYGLTTAWEPGGVLGDGAPATSDLQKAGRIIGPRWSHSASGTVGYPWSQLSTYPGALAAVQQHQDLGVDVLKEYNTPTREQRQRLSIAAHQSGLGIVSHIDGFAEMMTRIMDGYSGGEHPFIPMPFFKDQRELMRQTRYIWTPNVVVAVGNIGSGHDPDYYFWREVLDNRPWEREKIAAIAPFHRISYSRTPPQPNVTYQNHRVSRVAKQVAAAAAAGVSIGVSGHNTPGLGVHQEMWYLWKGGMPIEEVLRAATVSNAKKLGLHEEVGSLEVGKMADFVVLLENPLDNILNTLAIQYTVQGGVVYDSHSAERIDLLSLREFDERQVDVEDGGRKTTQSLPMN